MRIEGLMGDRLIRHLRDLATLRITVFREWPYLYDGDYAYEERYLAAFAAAKGAVIVGAFDGDELVGASTAAPMAHQTENIWGPIQRAGFAPIQSFYFGESVLKKRYRGQGLGVTFFQIREAYAQAFGGIQRTFFSSVIRDTNDARIPEDFRPLDGFWRKRGYAAVPGLTCTISWKEMGQAEESDHALQFWMKEIG